MSSNATSAANQKVVVERTYRASVRELWDLWATREGFESWWGPEGFRVEVHAIDPRAGGALHYSMIAEAPEMVAAMRQMGRPVSTETRGRFSEFRPYTRLALTHVIDFVPGVAAYESTTAVDFQPSGDHVRMILTLDPMHDEQMTRMAAMGLTSQLSKLDKRFGA
jgi:uncharacterized protein YndB with AHSA1/START domain